MLKILEFCIAQIRFTQLGCTDIGISKIDARDKDLISFL